MSPNPTQIECVLNENEYEEILNRKLLKEKSETNDPPLPERKYNYDWNAIIGFSLFHIQAIYGVYLMFTSTKLLTNVFVFILHVGSIFALTAGAHRLWSHRAYKATWQLKLLLMVFHTLTFQDSLYVWCRNHRMHHKYTDTDADPHNIRRGIFYSHIGWLLVDLHPEFKEKQKLIELSDLKRDPFIRFQIRNYYRLAIIIGVVFPTIVPWYFWNETLINAWMVGVCVRFVSVLHTAALVNSWAHVVGFKPYDASSSGRESFVASLLTLGEAWHNYHHTFPWDYRASELSGFRMNPTLILLKLFGKIGWAYDFKTVSDDIIRKRIKRTGDGSHPIAIWGWGDREQSDENKNFAIIENKQ